jgi:hypothetical protein
MRVLTFINEALPYWLLSNFFELKSIAAKNGDIGMGYAAIALAISGVAVGIRFRSKILVPIIGLLLLVAVAFSLARGFSFLDTALTILVSQAILQGSYFLGLVIRAIFSAVQCKRPIL